MTSRSLNDPSKLLHRYDNSQRIFSLPQISLSLPRDCICRTRDRISWEVVEIIELQSLHLTLRYAPRRESLPRIRRYACYALRTWRDQETRSENGPPQYGELDAPRSRQPLTTCVATDRRAGRPWATLSRGAGGKHARRVVGYVRSGSTRLVLSQRPIRGTWTRRLRAAPRSFRSAAEAAGCLSDAARHYDF